MRRSSQARNWASSAHAVLASASERPAARDSGQSRSQSSVVAVPVASGRRCGQSSAMLRRWSRAVSSPQQQRWLAGCQFLCLALRSGQCQCGGVAMRMGAQCKYAAQSTADLQRTLATQHASESPGTQDRTLAHHTARCARPQVVLPGKRVPRRVVHVNGRLAWREISISSLGGAQALNRGVLRLPRQCCA